MTTKSEMIDELTSLLRSRAAFPADRELDAGAPLEEIGIDSVDLAYVFAHFERRTGAVFADEDVDLGRYPTVGHLADTLLAKLAA